MVDRRWVPYRKVLKLWYEFLRDLPYKFTRQKPLGQYVADFYCSRLQLVIELDGDSHYTERALRYDEVRTAELVRQGVRVLRFTNLEVAQNFESVCTIIAAALEEQPRA